MIPSGYRALRDGVALVDLPDRGHIRATGEDRARLLHAMCTNHVQQLAPGQICYAFFLNAQGQIQADANLLCAEDNFLIDTEPGAARRLHQHLEKYIIADDVTLEDLTGKVIAIGLEGPGASDLLGKVGIAAPGPDAWINWQECLVAGVSVTGKGYRFFLHAADRRVVWEWLLGSGACPASAAELETVRIENARPLYGEDFDDHNIPHETRILRAVHFSKGCYLGQEIVERVRARGHVNRLLVQLSIDAVEPPSRGVALASGGNAVGEITSAAFSPAVGKVIALGYVRAQFAEAGSVLDAGGAAAEVTALVPG